MHHPRPPARAALVMLFGLLAACASAAAPSVTPPDGPSASPESTRATRSARPVATAPPDEPPVTGEVPDALLERIVDDAAERTGVPATDIELLRAESVTWNDGSLGCPEPGMVYTQALIDGFHIVVRAGDEDLDYRATSDGGFRLCRDPRPGG